MGLDIKIFRMNRLGIPQDRIANRLGATQASIHNHLLKMATLPNLINADLSRDFSVSQVAEKYNWTEPMACPQCLCMDLWMCRNWVSANAIDYINSITTHGRRVWSLALEGKENLDRFKSLNWGCGHGTCGTGTTVTGVSEMTGLPAIALGQMRQSASLKTFAQARRAGPVESRPRWSRTSCTIFQIRTIWSLIPWQAAEGVMRDVHL